jgi:hypothetical protein
MASVFLTGAVAAVESPPTGVRIWEVPEIRTK